jgi:hypothetical protein
MKLLHLIPIILIFCLIHSWFDFANAIKEKSDLAKMAKSSLKTVHSGVQMQKAKQTPIKKSKNLKYTKSEIGVKKSAKNNDKNHNTKKLNAKKGTNSKLVKGVKQFCKECCRSTVAVNRGTIDQKRKKNKRSKRMAGYCPYHGYYDEYNCGMCYQDNMFSGADNQYVVEAAMGGGTSSSAESAASSAHTASSNDPSTQSSSSSDNNDHCE